MANVPITAGSGTNIATNSVTRDAVTEQMELVNLADGTSALTATVTAAGTAGTNALIVQGHASGVSIPVTPFTVGIGVTTALPAATTNGAAITPPAGAISTRMYCPAGGSFTYVIATTAPTGAPAAGTSILVSNPTGNPVFIVEEPLSGTAKVYIVLPAIVGAPTYRNI